MILSKFQLDIRNFQGRKCIIDCQDMHRSIMRLFHCNRQEGNVLYRFNPKKMMVYIQSEKDPDLNDIPAGMNFKGKINMKGFEETISNGQNFYFDVLVSPTKKVMAEGAKNSRRKYLCSIEERLNWLNRKASQAGFAIKKVYENNSMIVTGTHKEDKGGRFHCKAVSYQGVLTVLDSEKFYNAWKKGIGSGKAYGQGMLLLSKIS